MDRKFQVYRKINRKGEVTTWWRYLEDDDIRMSSKEPFNRYGAMRAVRSLVDQCKKCKNFGYAVKIKKGRDKHYRWSWHMKGRLVAMCSDPFHTAEDAFNDSTDVLKRIRGHKVTIVSPTGTVFKEK